MRIRRNLACVIGVVVTLAACGSADQPEVVSELDPIVADSDGDNPGPPEAEPAAGVNPVAAAFQATADASAYRAEMAMGIDMVMDGEAVMRFTADPTQPMMFLEVDAEGQQYVRVDMGSMMRSVLASQGTSADEAEAMFGDMSMETWVDGTTMTIDIGGFGGLLAQTPGAADVFPTEVFTVDAERLGESIGGAELASAMTGQAAPDPAEMAAVLGELLGASETRGGAFSGTIGFLDYSRAFGQDPETVLGANTGALFDSVGGDDTLEAMLDVFERIDVDVQGTIVDGAIDTLRFDMDMSPIWEALPTIIAASGESFPADEMAEFEALVADARFDVTMLFDYDLDASVDVVVPDGDFPDATDQWIELFGPLVTG